MFKISQKLLKIDYHSYCFKSDPYGYRPIDLEEEEIVALK